MTNTSETTSFILIKWRGIFLCPLHAVPSLGGNAIW